MRQNLPNDGVIWQVRRLQALAAKGQKARAARHDVVEGGFEIAGVPEEVAREALRLATHKLPVKCKIVSRADLEGGAGSEE